MPRRDSNQAPPQVIVKKDPNIITETRRYKVITPLYGGGVEPGKADPITVVRVSEIRGHLRFWWRATRGGAFNGDLQKMREAEEKIWGSAGGKGKPGPSKVVVSLTQHERGKLVSKAKDSNGRQVDYGDVKSPYGYVAFPLRETKDQAAGSVRENVSFTLKIRYPRYVADDVLSALWAWETFGGIGARTRRGFGALQKIDSKSIPDANQMENAIREALISHVVPNGQWPPGVPHLSPESTIITTRQKESVEDAWQVLFNALKEFRQICARYDGKTGQRSAYGLSRWPEANAIRKFLRLSPRFPANVTHTVIEKFPRAVFGLPIGFEMHHDDNKKLELQGRDNDRLASPLILRPIACSDGAVGLAVLLEWDPVNSDEPYTPPGGLRLTGEKVNKVVQSKLSQTEVQQIPVLDGNPDVLQAFLDYLKGK